MDSSPDPEPLAKGHDNVRRLSDRIWLGLILIIAVGCVIAWLVSGEIENLYGGLFYAAFPLMGLIYTHFFLLNPRRDPVETQQQLVELQEKQQRNARKVALFNGSMLLIASPILILFGITAGLKYGIVSALFGGLAGSVCLVAGLLAIVWARRSRRTNGDVEKSK